MTMAVEKNTVTVVVPHDDDQTFTGYLGISFKEGHLMVMELFTGGQVLAIFAPGQWERAKVEKKAE